MKSELKVLSKESIVPYIPSLVLAVPAIVIFCMGREFRYTLLFGYGTAWYTFLLYHFSHANLFHLIANLWALFEFKPRWKTIAVGYISSTISAILLGLIPMSIMTCGMSGLIMACIARKYASWRWKLWRILAINVVLAFIPNFDWRIHLLSFFMSYAVWSLRYRAQI